MNIILKVLQSVLNFIKSILKFSYFMLKLFNYIGIQTLYFSFFVVNLVCFIFTLIKLLTVILFCYNNWDYYKNRLNEIKTYYMYSTYYYKLLLKYLEIVKYYYELFKKLTN
jgi:hypothetical protein